MTDMKLKYIAPAVKRSVEIEMEQAILDGSTVTPQSKIETAGQKVDTKDFSDTGFNSVWE